eukprot:14414598-Ditylum_brightwellii.AAC.2
MHPHHRLPFDDWINTISRHINIGDTYFKVCSSPAFDSMPAVLCKMTVNTRQESTRTIDEMQNCALHNEPL